MRSHPNIIICGTPGVGKTSHCEHLLQETDLKHLPINKVAEERGCYDGHDDEMNCWIIDEDKLADALEPELEEGGYLIDWHDCIPFSEDLVDLVVVLRTESEKHYDRLKARKYSQKKLDENIDCEIMQVILEDAREVYPQEVIVELQSNTTEDIDGNVERIKTWLKQWYKDHT